MKPANKILLNILLLSFIHITTQSEQSFSQSLHRARIYGKVTDRSTKEPLYFVNVFLSNTTLGCATDRDGVFILENIPPGKYNLVVTMIGYDLHVEEIKLKGRESYEYAIKLQPKVIEFPAVDEGFAIHPTSHIYGPDKYTHEKLLTTESIIRNGDSPEEKLLYFKDYLEVVYPHEGNYHTTWLKLAQDAPVRINSTGGLIDPCAIEFSGRMGKDRMGEELPWDYGPTSPEANGLSHSPQNVDYYLKGMEYLKTGDWEQALKTWWSGWSVLEMAGKSDPRIGIAFIEIATENKAEKYYGTASELYMWGFSNDDYLRFKEVVIKEAERIMPLLDTDEAKVWKKCIKIKDPKLCRMIRLFWLERDPRPKTKANERLIEHWERIAYARKHFQKTNHSVYDCDDRGTIYVKYGNPDKKKSGVLGTSSSATAWIGPFSFDMRLEDPSPEYEVWAYRGIGTEKPSIFLFSDREGLGSFGLCEGLESVLPPRIARTNFVKSFTIQATFQRIYYAELAFFDQSFYERHTEIEGTWHNWQMNQRRSGGQSNITSLLRILQGYYHRNMTADKFNPTSKYADADKSDYENLTGRINVKTHPVRLLDRQNRPRLALLTFSSPEFRVEDMKQISKESFEPPEYFLNHTLIIRNESLEEIGRREDLMLGSSNNVSSFILDHKVNQSHFILASEAYREAGQEQDSVSEYQSKVLAIGKETLTIQPQLNTDPGELELSDLVLGIETSADMVLSGFQFPVIPTELFTKQDPIRMAIEIYHLVLNEKAEARYTIEYGVAQLDKKGRRKKQQISMAYSFHTPGRTAQESLSVDISILKPGLYEFFVKVNDQVSRQEKTRKVKFVVVD